MRTHQRILELIFSRSVYSAKTRRKGIESVKQCSGQLNIGVPPDLHAKPVMAARAQGKSLNS